MSFNRFIGISILLFGLINPIGVIPIYGQLIERAQGARAHRIIITASIAVVCLLVAAALFGEEILSSLTSDSMTSESPADYWRCLSPSKCFKPTTGI